MDLITCLPRTGREHDSILVIVNIVTKCLGIMEVNIIDLAEDNSNQYIVEIVMQ